MPSSPKFFAARSSSSYTRRSTAAIVCFLIGITGFLFGFIALAKEGFGYSCKYAKPTSVSVVWDRTGNGGGESGNGANLSSDEGRKRYKVMGFVGIQTGFRSAGRRRALRQTWFPSDHQGLQRYGIFQ